MCEYKKYLHLRFENGGLLFMDVDTKKPAVKEIIEKENISKEDIKTGHNFANPIPYTMLSNVLTCLMGGIPVPTNPAKRKRMLHNISRPSICDELAKNAYFKLDTPLNCDDYIKQVVGDDGNYYSILKNKGKGILESCEFFKTAKLPLNSNRKVTVKDENGKTVKPILFIKDDGTPVRINGIYDFNTLRRGFEYNENNPLYVKLIRFISEILCVEDVTKTFKFFEMSKALYELREKNKEIDKKISEFVSNIKKEWDQYIGRYGVWMYAIFHEGVETSTSNISAGAPNVNKKDNYENYNCAFDCWSASKTYLTNRRGIGYKLTISGEIIVEITDEKIETALRNNSGSCSFLEGGMCYIMGLENCEPILDYKNKWNKISDETPPQLLDNESYM